MLCPKCHRDGTDKMMEIRGTQWYCPIHQLSVNFSQREPSIKEAFQIIASKEEYIAELEDEIIELKSYIRKLERRKP